MSTVCAAQAGSSRPTGAMRRGSSGVFTASRSPESETMRAWETFPIPSTRRPTRSGSAPVLAMWSTTLPASLKDDARVIDLTGQFIGHEGFVTGIGELNRKDMVRGAMRAAIPGAATQAAVIALLPLAKRGELHGEIVVEVAGVADTDVVKAAVLQLQPDFDGRISIVAAPDGFPFTARVTLPTNCTGSDVRAIYREEFADHNFVFVIPRRPVPADVTNTNKCLLHLHVQDSALTIEALMDASVKGAAGTAVHCMNLLFGLHEVIGLQLKALGR